MIVITTERIFILKDKSKRHSPSGKISLKRAVSMDQLEAITKSLYKNSFEFVLHVQN